MRYQSQDVRVRKVLLARVFMVIGFILVIALGRGVFKVYQLKQEAKERQASAEARLEDLREREALLEQNIAALKTPEGVEAALRSQFDVARQGEGLIIIVEESAPQETPVPRSWWERLWRYVSE